MKTNPRTHLLSHFVSLVGGYNATAGSHTGRFREWEQEFQHDDEKIARRLLYDHERAVTQPLREELKMLKARLFDAEERLKQAKK